MRRVRGHAARVGLRRRPVAFAGGRATGAYTGRPRRRRIGGGGGGAVGSRREPSLPCERVWWVELGLAMDGDHRRCWRD